MQTGSQSHAKFDCSGSVEAGSGFDMGNVGLDKLLICLKGVTKGKITYWTI